ncbi:uncharacterized protein LOC115324777 isoform X2 [Ixodes scapularis]|uniref:uncharacterized protein LOC115324777 isoform X2 n=1 Tax=Ixodes scapularis TaxID=6945 RepID=UPI001C380626|nr:uncharacterized protein LOC115324777 isoform X2 [Ixodes scapularis]
MGSRADDARRASAGNVPPGRSSPPPSFSQLGIPTGQGLQNTFLGPAKHLRDVSRKEWLFFGVSTLSLLVSLGFTIERLMTLSPSTDDYTFAIMLFYTACFCFFYIVHGILKERFYEIIVFIVSSVIVAIYLVLNVASNYYDKDPTPAIKIARLVVALVFLTGILWWGGQVAKGYWLEKRLLFHINAKADLQFMYQRLFLCSSLISFDLQLQGSMLIFVLENGTTLSQLEIWVLSVGPVVTCLWAVAGYLAMDHESKPLVALFFILWLPNVVYIGYRLYTLSSDESWTILFRATITCAILALLSRAAVAVVMALVVRNFGKGLMERLSAAGSLDPLHPYTYYRYSAPDVGVGQLDCSVRDRNSEGH